MDEIITSTGNPRVKEALRLRSKRGRAEGDRILIDGVREIGRAVEAGVEIDEVLFCDSLLDGNIARGLVTQIETGGAHVTQVSESVFDKIRYGDRTGGLVAVARRPKITLNDLRLSPTPLVAIVEGLEKPGNLGAIVRTADAAGVEAVLVVDPGTDLYGPNVIRASVGTLFCVPVVEVAAQEAVGWLKSHEFQIIAASPDAGCAFTAVDFTGRVAVVFGAEAEGLTRLWLQADILQASVPMRGKADSLNVATTAALFFYEALRQRGVVE